MVGLAVAKIVSIRTNGTVSAHVEVCLDAHACQVTNRKLQPLESHRMYDGYLHMDMVAKLTTILARASTLAPFRVQEAMVKKMTGARTGGALWIQIIVTSRPVWFHTRAAPNISLMRRVIPTS